MINTNLIVDCINERYPAFGDNKRQEVARLVFEIAKRDQCDFKEVLKNIPGDNGHSFKDIKQYLVKRRFPLSAQKEIPQKLSLKLDIDPTLKVDLSQKPKLIPDHFVVEEAVKRSPLVSRLKEKFPQAKFETTPRYKDYHFCSGDTYQISKNAKSLVRVPGTKKFSIKDYNNRLKTIFIVKEDYDFYKRCACSPKSVYCGYHVVNLGSGCGFDCSYCYLQDYINSPGIILPGNIEDFFKEFESYKQDIRMGSGEITDSLIFDHITEYSPQIVEFFKKYPKSTFEFKTKSNNVGNLLKVTPGDNIVVSWSMNPKVIVDSTEHFTASVDQRLEAALKCQESGYKLAFHFDPMIYFKGWEAQYENLVNQIYDKIDAKSLAWVSIGALRMTPKLKKTIENRFPENTILDEELIESYDGKLRYHFDIRTRMFQNMKDWIRKRDRDVFMYLCMEEKNACSVTETAPLKEYLKERSPQ